MLFGPAMKAVTISVLFNTIIVVTTTEMRLQYVHGHQQRQNNQVLLKYSYNPLSKVGPHHWGTIPATTNAILSTPTTTTTTQKGHNTATAEVAVNEGENINTSAGRNNKSKNNNYNQCSTGRSQSGIDISTAITTTTTTTTAMAVTNRGSHHTLYRRSKEIRNREPLPPPVTVCDDYYNVNEMFHLGTCTFYDLTYTIHTEHVVQVNHRFGPDPNSTTTNHHHQPTMRENNNNNNYNSNNNDSIRNCSVPYIRIPWKQNRTTSSSSSTTRNTTTPPLLPTQPQRPEQWLYYDFVQLHIHIGSDHRINQKGSAAEIHIVHRLRNSTTTSFDTTTKNTNASTTHDTMKQQQQQQRYTADTTGVKELLVVGILVDYFQLDSNDDESNVEAEMDQLSAGNSSRSRSSSSSNNDNGSTETIRFLQTLIHEWQPVATVDDDDSNNDEQQCDKSDRRSRSRSSNTNEIKLPRNKQQQQGDAKRSAWQNHNSSIHSKNTNNVFNPYTAIVRPGHFHHRGGHNSSANNDSNNATSTLLYSYHGSLTTPPCTENVLWYIVEPPINVPYDPIYTAIRQLMFPCTRQYENSNNDRHIVHPKQYNFTTSRPIQPLNNRTIVRYCPMVTTTTTTTTTLIENGAVTKDTNSKVTKQQQQQSSSSSIPRNANFGVSSRLYVVNFLLMLLIGWIYCYYFRNSRTNECHHQQHHHKDHHRSL